MSKENNNTKIQDSSKNLEHTVRLIKSELAEIAGMDVFSQADLDERVSDIDSAFGEGAGNAIVPYHDEAGYNEALAKKIEEKFAGIKGSDQLTAGVENALKICSELDTSSNDQQILTSVRRIQISVDNLKQVVPIAEAASLLAKKTEASKSKKGSLLYAQAQGYKELVSEFVKDAANVLSQDKDIQFDEKDEPKHIDDLGGEPVKITSSLKQKLFEVKYPIAFAIRKNIKNFTTPAVQRMDRSVRAVKKRIFNRGDSQGR